MLDDLSWIINPDSKNQNDTRPNEDIHIKMKKFWLSISVIIALFVLSLNSYGQNQIIQNDSLYSHILKEKRRFHIVLPKDYNRTADATYEIIYCLDDISDFLVMEWGFLQGEGFIPKNTIMVGITNPKSNGVDMRDRDFTPTKAWGISGGADQFLSFLKAELIPYINSRYNATNRGNVLYGGSLAGLFVMYAYLSDPTLFTSYIAIDPSLWWDNFLLSRMASTQLDSNKFQINNTLFIVGRKGNAFREMGVASMDSILRKKAPKGLDWKCVAYDNETHYSTNFKGFWDGLKFSYGGFYASTGGYSTSQKIVIKPKRGIVLKEVPFYFICYNLMADTYLHYTTDGSEPTLLSPTLARDETPISITKDSKIIVKSIGAREKYNRKDSAYFVIGNTIPSIPEPKNVKQGGLLYTYWDSMTDVNRGKPVKKGFANKDFDVNKLASANDFVCILTGYLKISTTGYYIIEMGGGNHLSKVYLNDMQVLGKHFIPGEGEMYLLPLEEGFYPFRIEYIHKKGEPALSPIYLKPEGVEDFPIPAGMLYSDNNSRKK